MKKEPVFEQDVKVIIIKKYYSETEAHIHQARLKEAGIKSFLSNAQGNYTPIPTILEGYNLHIREQDALEASKVISELERQAKTKIEEEFHDADHGDIQYEKSLNEYEKKLERTKQPNLIIWLLIILIVIALIYGFLINS